MYSILGPVVVNYMREYQLSLGIPREQVYNQTMYILVGLLMIGLVANLLVRPLNPKWFMTDAELAEEKRIAHEKSAAASAQLAGAAVRGSSDATPPIRVWLAWLAVGIPLAWGVYRTLLAAARFFG